MKLIICQCNDLINRSKYKYVYRCYVAQPYVAVSDYIYISIFKRLILEQVENWPTSTREMIQYQGYTWVTEKLIIQSMTNVYSFFTNVRQIYPATNMIYTDTFGHIKWLLLIYLYNKELLKGLPYKAWLLKSPQLRK